MRAVDTTDVRYFCSGDHDGRPPPPPALQGNTKMSLENQLDLNIALRKLHELALADGDLGYQYWHRVGELLNRAGQMQSEIDALKRELEMCRAKQR